MPSILHDVKYGARMLAKRPGLTAVAVLTLALGIGANSAIFSVVNGVLLRPLPYDEPERLVRVYTRWESFPQGSISKSEYLDVLDRNRVFEDLGLLRTYSVNVTAGDGGPERILGALMTPSVFATLRVQAFRGRTFLDEEGEAGHDRVALLSYGIWQRRFGGEAGVLGRELEIEGTTYTVAGVMPAGFGFPHPSTGLWMAYGIDRADLGSRGNRSNGVVARLAPGVTLAAAQADLDLLGAALREEHSSYYPEGSGFGFFLIPLREEIVGQVRGALLMLLAAVGFVLLIACANVANLLLARAISRRREMATRTALGAGRGHLVRQLMVESLMLSATGGAAALLVAVAGLRALVRFQPGDLPRMEEISLDGTALAFTFALTLSTGAIFGMIPALRTTGSGLFQALREGARGSGGTAHHRLRHLLVVAEVALATVLLIGAGLLIRSFDRLSRVDPGFAPDGVVTARLSLSRGRYGDDEAAAGFYQRLLERIGSLPGVVAAGAVSNPPLSGWSNDYSLGVEGYEPPAGGPEFIQLRVAAPGYFRTLGIPVLRGRAFTGADRADSQPVAVVSESLAERFWGDADPLGRRLKMGSLESDDPWMTVVGVVGELRHDGLQAPVKPMFYLPLSQRPVRGMTVVAKSAGAAAALLDSIRRLVLEIDPLQPVYEVRPMTAVVAASTAQPRFNLLLLATFAAMAMALAALGVYGVVSYLVSQRTREIGVRMALGAQTRDVLRNVLGHGLGMVGAGLALGLAGALALTRFLAGFLFGVSVRDPLTFAVNSALLVAVALAACLVPARRAACVDPTEALRHE